MVFPRQLLWLMLFPVCVRAAECDGKYFVPVRLVAEEKIDPAILRKAKEEARWVLTSLCVEVDWTTSSDLKTVTMRIMVEPITPDVPKHALGLSFIGPVYGDRGAVFLSRVHDTQQRFPAAVSLPILLGCVLAHEIGHLLLASGTHSSEGIMKAQFGRAEALKASQRGLIFTRSDRQRLAANHASLREFERIDRHEAAL